MKPGASFSKSENLDGACVGKKGEREMVAITCGGGFPGQDLNLRFQFRNPSLRIVGY